MTQRELPLYHDFLLPACYLLYRSYDYSVRFVDALKCLQIVGLCGHFGKHDYESTIIEM
jgi:hypothetical protein